MGLFILLALTQEGSEGRAAPRKGARRMSALQDAVKMRAVIPSEVPRAFAVPACPDEGRAVCAGAGRSEGSAVFGRPGDGSAFFQHPP